MTRFFTRACAKNGRFFWSWTFLKIVLWTVTLAIFLYVEEDWRGARTWAATKAEWEAKGETFDYNRLIQPPVPEDQNLAALPLFKLEPETNDHLDVEPLTLRKAMRTAEFHLDGYDFPHTGNWQRGDLADGEELRRVIALDYAIAFKGAASPQDTIAQFDALYPFLTDLRSAVITLPLCRLNLDYTTIPPANRLLGLLTDQITVSKILTVDAILALDEHRSDQALQDIRINYVLLSGVERNPTLVGGLVAIGMNAICTSAIFNGLAMHSWSDAQLAELDRVLSSIDFFADYQFDMRSTAAESVQNIEYYKKYASLSDRKGLFLQASDRDDAVFVRIFPRWPDGWWDNNKSKMAELLFHELATVDPHARLVFRNIDSDLSHQVDRATARWDAFAPWNIWFTVSAPPLANVTLKFASAQSWVDEARIACALERYRLAKDVYPGSLDALAPAYIEALPHDIMNGQPYHYQVRPDGTYLLYSVGWNQTDDGGKVFYRDDNDAHQKVIDYSKGDWVWPTPHAATSK